MLGELLKFRLIPPCTYPVANDVGLIKDNILEFAISYYIGSR
jgi:hypothetical protein